MPMRKRMYKRRSYRRTYRKYRKPTKTFARKVLKVVNRVQEKKYWPFSNTTGISAAGTVFDLCAVTQGDTDVTRDGDVIRLRSVRINFTCVNADAYNQIRFIMFQWMPTTTPTLTDILMDPVYPTLSPYQHDSRQNYRIIIDKTTLIDPDDPASIVRLYASKIPKRNIQFTASTTTGNNKVYVLAVSDSAAASHPSVNYSGKINFTDS